MKEFCDKVDKLFAFEVGCITIEELPRLRLCANVVDAVLLVKSDIDRFNASRFVDFIGFDAAFRLAGVRNGIIVVS